MYLVSFISGGMSDYLSFFSISHSRRSCVCLMFPTLVVFHADQTYCVVKIGMSRLALCSHV
jgi:hypothetical protein